MVDTQSQHYTGFVGTGNAPRGILVSKPFHGVFTDPDGDDLTYAVSIPDDRLALADLILIPPDGQSDGHAAQSHRPVDHAQRVWFRAEAEADWKAITPPLADTLVITATLTATDPEGLSASVSGDFRIGWESQSDLVSAMSDGAVIELTFDQSLQAAPAAGQFTVNVANEDGSAEAIAVSSVSVSGAVLTLELASALASGQSVTVDYAHSDATPLQRVGGGDAAPSFSGRAVELNVTDRPGAPQNFAVSVAPGKLDLWATWDAVEGATSYRLRWRQSGGEFEATDETTVSETESAITVSGYGEWEVRLQACDDGCGPEVSQAVDVVVPAIWLNLASAQDTQGQVRPRTFAASWDPVKGATSYILSWRRAGDDPPAPAPLGGASRQTRSMSGDDGQRANTQEQNRLNLPGDQTSAEFNVPDDGEYRANLEARNDKNEVIAQGDNTAKQGTTRPTPRRRGWCGAKSTAIR